MRLSPVVRVAGAILVALAIVGPQAYASSHREALAILNEPCADNTDTFAWVSNGTHDKLYLIMDYNPLHEPGQGNQGSLRIRSEETSELQSPMYLVCRLLLEKKK